jgi:hypothetical protein
MTAIRHHDPVTPAVGGPPPRRSRWWWVGGAVLLLLVVVAAFILGRGGRTETPVAAAPTVTIAASPAPTPSSVVVSASPGAVGEDTANPDGCLGGPDPYTAILPAQAAATLDVAGAAGFARAAVRYLLVQYPGPADYDTVVPQVFVDPDTALARAATPREAVNPPPVGTTTKFVRPAESAYIATVLGDRADVTVSVYMELDYPDGTPPNTVRLTQRLLLQAVDGKWRIIDPPATDPMPDVGTGGARYFPGGC